MKIMCWTHHDLDGLISALMVKWTFPDMEFEYESTNPTKFRDDFTKWLTKHDIEDYYNIYFVDLDLSNDSDLVDFNEAVIIDHHNSHVDKDNYVYAKTVIKNYSSACLLIYRTFRAWYDVELNDHQKLLITLGDDVDSHSKKIAAGAILNTIFWQTQNRFPKFMEQLDNGFRGITDQQKTMYKMYKKDLKQTKEKLEYFIDRNCKILSNAPVVVEEDKQINDEQYYVIATFATKYINDVADYLFEEYDCDIAVVVNRFSKHVSWRRNDKCKIDLGTVAEILTDGGCHTYSAGGFLTPDFVNFSKKLKPKKRHTLLKYNDGTT